MLGLAPDCTALHGSVKAAAGGVRSKSPRNRAASNAAAPSAARLFATYPRITAASAWAADGDASAQALGAAARNASTTAVTSSGAWASAARLVSVAQASGLRSPGCAAAQSRRAARYDVDRAACRPER
eukprot:CAMPEP_0119277570 /NCGR_PEP_ID=MMETSP1329-20130426/17434_1 /TAXON_ID=114041 /ORGANISM="Genus nov. species nov., Strain RCC1024" /LENGTH=127 /DNA_ID=CAMNT_0007278045 /DNA_START=1133 /DNA_END=1517 /DNA_ORIENTATION=+